MSLDFKIIYKKFIDDARVLPFDETFMIDIEKNYKIRLLENIKNIYTNAPTYYTKITQSDEIFELYELWFLSIFIIDFSNESTLSKYKTKSDILKWVTSRKDPNISFFLVGPKQNQYVRNDFISHYRNLMNAQNTITDISQYLELSSLQNLNVLVDNFKNDIILRPNSFDKLPNYQKTFTINIDSKYIDIKILNYRTVMDCNSLDLNDVSETTSLSKYKSLIVNQTKQNQNSKIPIKKLETLLNTYGRIKINSFTIDNNVFDASIQNFDKSYIVFDGVYVNERNIYSDSSNECLRIIGTFSFNQDKNIYTFTPDNEYITFRTNESIVRKFNIYVEFVNVGTINKVFNMTLSYSDFLNIFINQSKNSSSSSSSNETNLIEYDKVQIDYIYFSTDNVTPFNIFIVDNRYYISRANTFTQHTNEYYFINLNNNSIESKLFDNISSEDRLLLSNDLITFDKLITVHDGINLLCFTYHDKNNKFCVETTLDMSSLGYPLYIIITDDFEMFYGLKTFDEIVINISYNVIIVNNEIVSTTNQQSYQFILRFVRISDKEIIGYHTDSSMTHVQFIKITKNSLKDENSKVLIDVSNIKYNPGSHIYYSVSEINGSTSMSGCWFNHKTFLHTDVSITNGFKLENKISYKNIHKSLMFMDLSKQYLKTNDIIFRDIIVSDIMNTSGILLDNEFIKCNKYYIQGTTLFILIDNNNIKYTKQYNVTNKSFTVFPSVEYKTINPKDITEIIGFFKQNEYGKYDFVGMTEMTDIIGYFYLSQYDQSVLLCIINILTIGILVLTDEGDYELYDFYVFDIIKNTLFTYDNTNIFRTYDFHNFYTLHYNMSSYKYIKYPTPLLTLECDVLKNYLSMNMESYSRFSIPENKALLDSVQYTLRNFMEFNPLYNNYPVIITNEKLITNKKYKLIIDNNESSKNEYEGFVLKNGDYYSFCCDEDIILSKNSKITLKINDTIMTCSFQLD